MTNPQAFQCPVLKKLALRVMLLLNLMTKNGIGMHLWNLMMLFPINIILMLLRVEILQIIPNGSSALVVVRYQFSIKSLIDQDQIP